MQPEFVRLKTISTMSGLSTKTLRRYIKSNLLKAIKFGGNYYVSLMDYKIFVIKLQLVNKGIEKDNLGKLEELCVKAIQKEENDKFSEMCKSFGISDEVITKFNEMKNALW